jgi:hypothetical protein
MKLKRPWKKDSLERLIRKAGTIIFFETRNQWLSDN